MNTVPASSTGVPYSPAIEWNSRPSVASYARTSGSELGAAAGVAGVQDPAPLNTTMSPGSIARKSYTSLLTSTLSPIRSVSSIDDDGMKNACTTNVLINSAMASATASSTGSSPQNDRRLRRASPGPAPPSAPPAPVTPGSGAGCSSLIIETEPNAGASRAAGGPMPATHGAGATLQQKIQRTEPEVSDGLEIRNISQSVT